MNVVGGCVKQVWLDLSEVEFSYRVICMKGSCKKMRWDYI